MNRMIKASVSLYGSIAIPKVYCGRCKADSFVISGKIVCCDKSIEGAEVKAIKRECNAEFKLISKAMKQRILVLQHNRCYLCGCELNKPLWYSKKGQFRRIRVEFDHFIPKVFAVTNHPENIYAMCSLCNKIKGGKVFDSREQAMEYVIERRKEKGTMDLFDDFEKQAYLTEESPENTQTSLKSNPGPV